MAKFEGSWIAGETAGGGRNYLDSFANNPQFRITVEDPDEDDDDNLCTAIVSLMQKGRRCVWEGKTNSSRTFVNPEPFKSSK